MSTHRQLLVLCSLLSLAAAAPVQPIDVLILVPQSGSADVHHAKLVPVPVPLSSATRLPFRSSVTPLLPVTPTVGHLVFMNPIPVLTSQSQPPHQVRTPPATTAASLPLVTASQQAIGHVNETTQQSVGGSRSASESLPLYFPIKVDGQTALVEQRVTVPVANATKEASTREASKSTGTPLDGLTREELAQIISQIVVHVLQQQQQQQGGRNATATETMASATAAAGQKDPSAGEEEPRSRKETRQETSITGGGSQVEQKARRQLSSAVLRRNTGDSRDKSLPQSAARPGVMSVGFKPVSTTATPESSVPVEDMMDPLLSSLAQDPLLENRKPLDGSKQKNELFLSAIKEVLQDIGKMYEVPGDTTAAPLTQPPGSLSASTTSTAASSAASADTSTPAPATLSPTTASAGLVVSPSVLSSNHLPESSSNSTQVPLN